MSCGPLLYLAGTLTGLDLRLNAIGTTEPVVLSLISASVRMYRNLSEQVPYSSNGELQFAPLCMPNDARSTPPYHPVTRNTSLDTSVKYLAACMSFR
jgi:hypothetical protein